MLRFIITISSIHIVFLRYIWLLEINQKNIVFVSNSGSCAYYILKLKEKEIEKVKFMKIFRICNFVQRNTFELQTNRNKKYFLLNILIIIVYVFIN